MVRKLILNKLFLIALFLFVSSCTLKVTHSIVQATGGDNGNSTNNNNNPVIANVATPVIDPVSGSYSQDIEVRITCTTYRADIYYTTDGSMPTEFSEHYLHPIVISGDGTVETIKAIAIKDGMLDSDIASQDYIINYAQVSTPAISPLGDTFNDSTSISITCATYGALIYYTTDGSGPTAASTYYTGAFPLAKTATVKAIAIKDEMIDSTIASNDYTLKVATPVITPASETSPVDIPVTILSDTPDAVIYYTTNGEDPTQLSTLYTGMFMVSSSGTVKARAFKGEMDSSDIASVEYIIIPPPPPLDCGTVLTESTVLGADMNCSAYNGDALTIGANGITLDGDGHKIYVADGHVGVLVNSHNNIVVKKLEINSLSSGSGDGILMSSDWGSVDNITLDNVIIHNRSYGVEIDFFASDISINNSDLSNNGVGFWGSWYRSITGLTFSGINVIDNCSIGLHLGGVSNLSVTAPVSVQNSTSVAVVLGGVTPATTNDLSSAVFNIQGVTTTALEFMNMSDFTLQGDTTETPSSVIDLTNNSDLGKLRFNFDSSMENINTPITFADVGAEGHPVYVKNMNLTGTGGTGYGIYMAPNYSSVDNITLDNVVIHGRQFAVVTDFTASNIFIKNSDLSSNGAGFWGSWDRSINGLEFSGNNITNNSIGIWLNNVRNSDGSQFDASTIYHNNFYNNGLNISVDEGSGILALGGNFWGHVEAPCFYTVESGLIPADANRTGIDDLGCFTSENGWLP